jgi:hypothetical protein
VAEKRNHDLRGALIKHHLEHVVQISGVDIRLPPTSLLALKFSFEPEGSRTKDQPGLWPRSVIQLRTLNVGTMDRTIMELNVFAFSFVFLWLITSFARFHYYKIIVQLT